jgi:hypothetical protein
MMASLDVMWCKTALDYRVGAFWTPSRSAWRQTSTGIFEWVNTFRVSLPSRSALTPRRPCEAMKIRSRALEIFGRRLLPLLDSPRFQTVRRLVVSEAGRSDPVPPQAQSRHPHV